MPASTQVHNIETTVAPDTYDSYRAYRTSFCTDEVEATQQLYSILDENPEKPKLKALNECRKWAWFVRDSENGHVHVMSNSCRLRWCPICSTARSRYMVQNIRPWISSLNTPRFLTLTMKHSNAPLAHQIDILYKNFRNLRLNKQFKEYVHGGIWFFQVKLNKAKDQWHPHIHCILQGKYIPHVFLSKLWYRVTKCSHIVDIRLVTDPEHAANEVSKYSARPAHLKDYDIELRIEIYHAMHGRRLCGKWGTAKAVSLSPPKKLDKDQFPRVGSWTVVIGMKSEDARAQAIYDAWSQNLPLASDISILQIDNFVDGVPDRLTMEVDRVIEQLLPGFT